MKKKKGKEDFIRKHEYPGGKKAFGEFISANLVYPKAALDHKVQGTVFLEYEVGFDGEITKVNLLKGIGHGCDEEAMRLVRLLKFAPQNNHGVKLSVKNKLQIHFKLPVEKKTVVQYNVTKKKTEANPEKNKKSNSYTMTIKLR